MRIISWNCNMAFRKKYHAIMELKPDLLVLQECENKDKLSKILEVTNANCCYWHGNNPNKGIAVLAFNGLQVKLIKNHNLEFEYILPLKVCFGNIKFNLFNIWAMPHLTSNAQSYVGQIWNALPHYEKLLKSPSILIGDFNSNAIWDKSRRMGNHSHVVSKLFEYKIQSLYHDLYLMEHGKEANPTFYLYKNINKPYHMDYCFASKKLLNPNTSLEIGGYEIWSKLSDHMPLIIDHIGPEISINP
ncbi:MAG: endonuclease/exonuclease/phosphatase family protein [Saprospiraceae bacterium]|nr:endonuclease/exonuclease/phosphatase family protein [Saprospiraceae bacterium]